MKLTKEEMETIFELLDMLWEVRPLSENEANLYQRILKTRG